MSLCSGPSVDQSPSSVSWELFQDKGRTWRSAAEGVHTYSEEVRERERGDQEWAEQLLL